MALRESEARLQLAQAAAGSIVWEWDLESDRLTCSEHARQLFGVDIDSLARTGKEHLLLMHPDDRGRMQDAIRRLLKDDEDLHEEVQFWSRASRGAGWPSAPGGSAIPTGRVLRTSASLTTSPIASWAIALRESEEKYRAAGRAAERPGDQA
jgi:PAS domain-containing protein